MLSILINILLICAIIVVASYILDNLIIALVVCSVIVAFFSRKPKKKVESKHDICKHNLKEVLNDTEN